MTHDPWNDFASFFKETLHILHHTSHDILAPSWLVTHASLFPILSDPQVHTVSSTHYSWPVLSWGSNSSVKCPPWPYVGCYVGEPPSIPARVLCRTFSNSPLASCPISYCPVINEQIKYQNDTSKKKKMMHNILYGQITCHDQTIVTG